MFQSVTTNASGPTSESSRFWLFGGSGAVGQNLVRLLSKTQNAHVIVVSRRPWTSLPLAEHVETRTADLTDPSTAVDVHPGDRIINLTEATLSALTARAIRAGAIFIETSASPDYVSAQSAAAAASNGPGILIHCVGVAPGLTTLMAHALVEHGEIPEAIEIGIELGLGKHAGFAATVWTIASLGRPYAAKRGHRLDWIHPGQVSGNFRFGKDARSRGAIGFPFADQLVLAEALPGEVGTILTYLAFDPPIVTRFFRLSTRFGMGKVMANRSHRVARVLQRLPAVGRASTRLTVQCRDARGAISGRLHLTTGDQSIATAAVAASTASQDMVSLRGKASVFSIADVLSLDAAVQRVTEACPKTKLVRQTPPMSRKDAGERTIPIGAQT